MPPFFRGYRVLRERVRGCMYTLHTQAEIWRRTAGSSVYAHRCVRATATHSLAQNVYFAVYVCQLGVCGCRHAERYVKNARERMAQQQCAVTVNCITKYNKKRVGSRQQIANHKFFSPPDIMIVSNHSSNMYM